MYIGFDTSNYTTSFASFDGKNIVQSKKMLRVKSGERGLRQSEALFQHTVNLPEVMSRIETSDITAVGVSVRPRNAQGSYMPCFLAGETCAEAFAKAAGVPIYKTSHQAGHILAALYSSNRLDLINEKHIAFHLSGGTTEALLVTPDKDEIIKAEIIAQSLDLKAGQAIDRAGVMLGLDFPCGKALDTMAQKSEKTYKLKPSMKGTDCSLSGVENKAKAMLDRGEAPEDISRFVLSCVCETVSEMLRRIIDEHGKYPVIFSGGVSSNTMLREKINSEFEAYFALPEFSLDNAAGCAVYAYLKDGRI